MTASLSPQRTRVFICYSQEDKEHYQRLLMHLTPDIRNNGLDVWDTTRIQAGTHAHKEIQDAVQSARVAIVLVSIDVMASNDIWKDQLSPLLEAAKQREVTLLPVLVKPCDYESILGDIWFVNEPQHESLVEMSEGRREKLWLRVALDVKRMLEKTSGPASGVRHGVTPVEEAKPATPISELYLQALKNDQTITSLKVLDMNAPLSIEDIYIQLQVHEEPSGASGVRREEITDPVTLLQQKDRLLDGRVQTALDPVEALRKYKHCVIQGNPGAGKTTLLKYLTIQAANNAISDLSLVPVYIRLNAFAVSGETDLLTFAAATWEKEYGAYGITASAAQRYLEELLAQQQALFLLDALDEAIVGEDVEQAEGRYQRVADAVILLANRCSWVIVTTRKAGYQRRKLQAFSELELLDFRFEEIEYFIDRWFQQHPIAEKRSYGDSLKVALDNQSRIRALAGNPLLLTLITLYYERRHSLPERRSELYESCVDTLMDLWDKDHRRDVHRHRLLDVRMQRRLLQVIAWHFHCQGMRYFPQKQLLEIVTAFLPKIQKQHLSPQSVLDDITGDAGLLREQGEQLYGFVHLTFQEYFSSLAAINDRDLLLSHLVDSWWEEVIILYAGVVDDASPLFVYLLTAIQSPSSGDDIFASKLLLAGRCLAARPILDQEGLWEQVFGLLLRKLQQAGYALFQQHLADVLAEIASAYLDNAEIYRRLLDLVISEERKARISVRVAVVVALGTFGVREIAEELLNYLVITSDRIKKELRSAIFATIGKLADQKLIPWLIELVFDPTTDPFFAHNLISIIQNVKDSRAAQALFPLITDTRYDLMVRSYLAMVVPLLSDDELCQTCLALVGKPDQDELIVASVLTGLAFRERQITIVPMLPDILSGLLVAGRHLPLTSFLSEFDSPNLVDSYAKILSDTTVDIAIREVGAQAFTRSALRARRRDDILSLLVRADIEDDLRCEVAFTVALSGDTSFVDEFPMVRRRETDEQVRDALNIASGVLGYRPAISFLRDQLLYGWLPPYLGNAAADTIAQHILPMELSDVLTTTPEWLDSEGKVQLQQRRIQLVEALARTDKSAYVPVLCKVLSDRVVVEDVRVSIAQTIGVLGYQRATVEQLLVQWQKARLSDHQFRSKLAKALYQALWVLCRKAHVTIVPVGPVGDDFEIVDV